MWLRKLFRKKTGHDLTDLDRQKGIEIRQTAAELRLQEMKLESEARQLRIQRDIAKFKADIAELSDNTDDEDMDLSGILKVLNAFQGGKQMQTPSQDSGFIGYSETQPPEKPFNPADKPAIHLSEAEIKKLWKSQNAFVKKAAKNMNDDSILSIINQKVGAVDLETQQNILKTIRQA